MKLFIWMIRFIVFFLLLALAVKNGHFVVFKGFFDREWQVQLIVVVLVAFSLGVIMGVIFPLSAIVRQRRQLALLTKKLKCYEKKAGQHNPPSDELDGLPTVLK